MARIAWLGISLMPLAACGTTDRIVPASTTPDDYRARHPILIADAKSTIDLFPSIAQGQLDTHTQKQIVGFADQYREVGHGPILVLVPRSIKADRDLIPQIRRVLLAAGARSGIDIATYPVANPLLASPVRLSFGGTKAVVADQCGQWPSDLGSGSSIDGWENKSYWNFGCTTQQMIAAQTADPRDLVEPRGEEVPDTTMRSRDIDSIRKGTDPSTDWKVRNSSISNVGGGS
jgi:pilus assembly protein CpaD